MSRILFDIEGGKPVSIECNPGDNLLEVARRANVADRKSTRLNSSH